MQRIPTGRTRKKNPQNWGRESYTLRLANGLTWSLVSTEASRSWVMRLARIMRLAISPPNSYPRLIFCRGDLRQRGKRISGRGLLPDILQDLPENGWKVRRERGFENWYHPESDDVIVDLGVVSDETLGIIPMGDALMPIYNQVIARGGLPLHAALVQYRKCGILVAASGGGGKSTCAHRLPLPWKSLSDDAALIVPGEGNGYRVHPMPTWSEYAFGRSMATWHVEEHLPVSSVFFLEKALCDAAVPVGQAESAVSLYHAAASGYGAMPTGPRSYSIEKQIQARIFENSCELARAVPCYLLKVSLTGRFWEEMERVLEPDCG
jgi:SynChlorMet cassette protein ScmC